VLFLFLFAEDCRDREGNPTALGLFISLPARFLFLVFVGDRRGKGRTGTFCFLFTALSPRVVFFIFVVFAVASGLEAALTGVAVEELDAVADSLSHTSKANLLLSPGPG